jgi:hypothetical protein
MSALDDVRKKFEFLRYGTDKTAKSPFVSSVSPQDKEMNFSSAREQRLQHVKAALDLNPGLRFSWFSDGRPDASGNVIVAVAIRDIGACEVAIDAARYDPFTLLEIIAAPRIDSGPEAS